MIYVILFPIALVLLFFAGLLLILDMARDPLPWITALVVCLGVFAVIIYQVFRDAWREWRAERRSKS